MGGPEFRSLGLERSLLQSVSQRGELAVLTRLTRRDRHRDGGVLATVAVGGDAPRELAEDVSSADWSPDGSQLAVVRVAGNRYRVESPPGTVRSAAEGEAWLGALRFSPDGGKLAYLHHPLAADDRGSVAVLDLASGESRTLGPEWSTVSGLAWAPDGRHFLLRIVGATPDAGLDEPGGWDAEGTHVYLTRHDGESLRVFRVEPGSGRREPWADLRLGSLVSVLDGVHRLAADGRRWPSGPGPPSRTSTWWRASVVRREGTYGSAIPQPPSATAGA